MNFDIEHPSYGHTDPRWVGAWWISFVIIGLMLVVLGLLMTLFPKNLIGYNRKPEIKPDVAEESEKKSKLTGIACLFFVNKIE